ncbi:MAG TPA: hypothetical protein VIT45_13290 [Allosphingosinicella sp.]
MRFILALTALLLGLAGPLQAQSSPAWSRSKERITVTRAGISFPIRAGTLSVTETKEFSHQGESLDIIAQYRSSDQEVLATVYVYYPGIAHAGLAALATDEAIRLNSSNPPGSTGPKLTAAAGKQAVGIRTDYTRYRGDWASSAAFIKAGRWIVKLRVSGPEARADEVKAAMSDLLAKTRFEGAATPRPAAILTPAACPDDRSADAALVADDPAGNGAVAIMISAFDPVAPSATDRDSGTKKDLPSRIGEQWCRSVVQVGQSKVPLLRATDPQNDKAIEGKSMLLALYSDAGGLLEVVRLRKAGRYLLMNHQIGATSVLGTFAAMPSDRQIAEILAGRGDAGRIRSRINLKSDGSVDVEVESPPVSPTT